MFLMKFNWIVWLLSLMAIHFPGLFNAKVILVEEQQWYYLMVYQPSWVI